MIILGIVISVNCNAQFVNNFVYADSTGWVQGFLTEKTLERSSDSLHAIGSYKKLYYNNFLVDRVSSKFNDGTITGRIPWVDNAGNFRVSNNIPSSYITGLSINDYTNTVAVSGGAGQAVFYITSDKTSSGTALYSTIDAVIPLVNDASQNYTYGWSYNSTTKALTVTCKTNLTAVIALLTVILGPTNAPNGTNINVTVKGH